MNDAIPAHKNTAFLEFLDRYGVPAGPEGGVKLVQEVLGADPDDWQKDILLAYGEGERHISIAACHGPGKTAVAAWLVWIQLLTRFPQLSAATAPSKSQLEDALMKEINVWYDRMPKRLRDMYKLKTNRVEFIPAPADSFFTAATARAESPEALQGKHSDHVLLVVDEASGVPEAVFEAAIGSMSGRNATTVLLSNPTRSSGFFFNTHHKNRDLWYTKQIGIDDSPRVTQEMADLVAAQYGEDSNAYRIRVLGQFPIADEDTVVPYELAATAAERDVEAPTDEPTIWSVDPGRQGDPSGFVERRGRVVTDLDEWNINDTMKLAGKIKAKYDEASRKPDQILIDEIGLGYGVLDRLRELGLPARGINVAESPSAEERFMRLRDELWWKTREWLEGLNVSLPSTRGDKAKLAEQLISELTAPTYDHTSSGKIKVEAKKDMKKRIGYSPNLADALVLSFAIGAATLRHGSSLRTQTSWKKPLKRGLKIFK